MSDACIVCGGKRWVPAIWWEDDAPDTKERACPRCQRAAHDAGLTREIASDRESGMQLVPWWNQGSRT